MKKKLLILVCLIIFSGSVITLSGQKQKVIYDTDLGGDIDDAYALALLLTSPEIELLPYHQAGVEKYRRIGRTYALHATQPPSLTAMNALAESLQTALAQTGITILQVSTAA